MCQRHWVQTQSGTRMADLMTTIGAVSAASTWPSGRRAVGVAEQCRSTRPRAGHDVP
jgi:hypothetical protein